MRGLLRSLSAAICVLALSANALAAETKEDKLSSDQTQQQYTRKSMTFVGSTFDRGVNIPDHVLPALEAAMRKGIELKRFDYNAVDVNKFGSMDGFIAALREYVKKRAQDRAAAEAEMDTRFKEARVYASDIDRIMSSAYFYKFNWFVYRSKSMICPSDAKTAARLGCAPGVAGIQATVNAEVVFYKADLSGEGGKGYSVLRTLKDTPGKGFTPYDVQPPAKPRPPQLPAGVSDAVRRDMRKKYEAVLANWRRAMDEYNRRMPELKRKAEAKAAVAAVAGGGGMFSAASLVNRLSQAMKRIPDFMLKTPVTAALSDGVEFMLGAREGLEIDDTYEVAEYDQAGKKSRIGWVKVRKVSKEAKGTGEGSPSYAEKVKENRNFVGGESLFEYSMLKLDVGLHGVFEFSLSDLVNEDETGSAMYFGAGAYILYDLGPAVGWPDFWAGIEFDYLAVGETFNGDSVSLVHAMLGLKKRWYINSLVFSLGLRGGISYYSTDDQDQEDTTLIGGGGDLVLGVEYYIHPMFSVYLNVAGRFFTNPMQFLSTDAEPEMGGQANLGIRLGL